MEIKKVNLKNEGYDGMIVTYVVYKRKKGKVMPVDRDETIRVPVSKEIIRQMSRMKVPFLWLVNYWQKEFNEFIDKNWEVIDQEAPAKNDPKYKLYERTINLIDDLVVTEIVRSNDGGIQVIGKMKSLINTKFSISSPLLREVDEFPLFNEMIEIATSVFNMVELFMEDETSVMMEPRTFLRQYKPVDEVNEMTEEEAYDQMIKKLEEKGAIVLTSDEFGKEIIEKKKEDLQHEETTEDTKPQKEEKPKTSSEKKTSSKATKKSRSPKKEERKSKKKSDEPDKKLENDLKKAVEERNQKTKKAKTEKEKKFAIPATS